MSFPFEFRAARGDDHPIEHDKIMRLASQRTHTKAVRKRGTPIAADRDNDG